MSDDRARDVTILLLFMGIAAEGLVDDLPDTYLVGIFVAAFVLFAWPLLRTGWAKVAALIERRLHPPVIRIAESAQYLGSTTRVLSTHPFGRSRSTTLLRVAVLDQMGRRLDGVRVTFQTDNGLLSAADAVPYRGRSVVTYTDTDTPQDLEFRRDNPLQAEAGTAEVELDCSLAASGISGRCNITITIDRQGASIVLHDTLEVRGAAAVTGLSLRILPPDRASKGSVVTVIASLVDASGQPVVDETPVFMSVNGGTLTGQVDSQGGFPTISGEAHATWLTDRESSGVFTIVARTGGIDSLGQLVSVAQWAEEYETF